MSVSSDCRRLDSMTAREVYHQIVCKPDPEFAEHARSCPQCRERIEQALETPDAMREEGELEQEMQENGRHRSSPYPWVIRDTREDRW